MYPIFYLLKGDYAPCGAGKVRAAESYTSLSLRVLGPKHHSYYDIRALKPDYLGPWTLKVWHAALARIREKLV